MATLRDLTRGELAELHRIAAMTDRNGRVLAGRILNDRVDRRLARRRLVRWWAVRVGYGLAISLAVLGLVLYAVISTGDFRNPFNP